MGFEELSDEDLIQWLHSWIGDVAARISIETPVDAGHVTVSARGELDRVELTAAAMTLRPGDLGQAIEQAYLQAYQAALLDVDQILNRIVDDIRSNSTLVARIKKIRANYPDLAGLRTVLKRRQAGPDAGWDDSAEWDPSADPLKRRI